MINNYDDEGNCLHIRRTSIHNENEGCADLYCDECESHIEAKYDEITYNDLIRRAAEDAVRLTHEYPCACHAPTTEDDFRSGFEHLVETTYGGGRFGARVVQYEAEHDMIRSMFHLKAGAR